MTSDAHHSSSASAPVDRTAWPYKMKDLCELTGVPRQVVHFYIQQGLLPEGHKTGRNMAYYGPQHVERVRLIRQLQHERFLPLKAIRAMLEERDDAFSPSQLRLLEEVKQKLRGALASRPHAVGTSDTLRADEVLARLGLERRDLDEMVEGGVIGTIDDASGATLIARDDVWMLESFAAMRALGFTRDLGFTATEFAIYEEAAARLFKREAALLTARLAHLPAERVAAMVENALPTVNAILAKFHTAHARNFFATL
jgi:DNA-binding transcriptional MerR regulator